MHSVQFLFLWCFDQRVTPQQHYETELPVTLLLREIDPTVSQTVLFAGRWAYYWGAGVGGL